MSRMTLIGGVAAIVLAAAAGAATAQQAPAQAPERQDRSARMLASDTDNDGRISQAEFTAKAVERVRSADGNGDGTVTAEERRAVGEARRAEHMAERFSRLDTNGDGAISQAEFEAAPAMRGGREGRRGGRGEGRGGERGGWSRDAGHRAEGARGMRGPRGADGATTVAEAQTQAAERFARMDANNDGYLTAEDRAANREANAERRQERRERMQQRRAARAAQASPATPSSE